MISTNLLLYSANSYKLKYNAVKNNNSQNLGKTANFKTKKNNLSFCGNFTFPNLNTKYVEKNGTLVEAPSISQIKENIAGLDLHSLWEELNKENEQKQYIKFEETINNSNSINTRIFDRKETYETSPEAIIMLRRLDSLDKESKSIFIRLFCEETGFPSLDEVTQEMESEIQSGVHKLADANDSTVKFIGYDRNCSVGRKCALPGKDCDGLFIIIEPPINAPKWFAGSMRWDLKDVIRQRIVSTPSNHLPEVLTTEYIEQGLEIASQLFYDENFSKEDLARFKENLKDSSKDFVKSAEFDIRLAKKLPRNVEIREKFYKTAMFVELLRDGRILENQFSSAFISRVKNSPLYKYSNIMKQQGFENSQKRKHILRKDLVQQFQNGTPDEQYKIIRDILHSSLGLKDTNKNEFFENNSEDGSNEMGNIVEMYDMLNNAV